MSIYCSLLTARENCVLHEVWVQNSVFVAQGKAYGQMLADFEVKDMPSLEEVVARNN